MKDFSLYNDLCMDVFCMYLVEIFSKWFEIIIKIVVGYKCGGVV